MRVRRPGVRAIAAVAGAATVAITLVACSGGSNDTLSPIAGGSTGPTTTAVTPSGSSAPGTSVDPGTAGAGYVQIDVQVASSGISETVSLDRATVNQDALDPVSLDATCTPLDHGDTSKGVEVTVVDLRRLGRGDRFVSAVLHVDPADSGGEHRATLQLSGADQVTTSYTGKAELAAGGWGGTFQMNDAGGNPATGTFACADQAPPPTTAPSDTDAGETVPDTPAPTAPSGT